MRICAHVPERNRKRHFIFYEFFGLYGEPVIQGNMQKPDMLLLINKQAAQSVRVETQKVDEPMRYD